MKISEITQALESFAPLAYQESYDNCGLLVGDTNAELSKVLVTLDVTEEVVEEALKLGCNLIVAHHPIIFKGLKKIANSNYVERTVVSAIKKDIAIYAIHTNLDNVVQGVSFRMAQKLGLQNIKILDPQRNKLSKLTVFVPNENVEVLAKALHDAGAGNIGNYQECSFRMLGTGTFKPNEFANPHLGQSGIKEYVNETRIEFIFPAHNQFQILQAMKAAHPYEEVAHFFQPLDNEFNEVGAGAIGEFKEEMDTKESFQLLKSTFQVPMVRHTNLIKQKIKTVAMCGGSGSFLTKKAISCGADIFITSDIKYHEFFDAENRIILADIGHYESEQFTKEILSEIILKKFPNIAVLLSKVVTNPVQYT
ncbi:MAG: Nif3-like dinuclear metal center hexameric protein [Bacteroidota bacterium]|nr:Nif3-like dinuclear metal center hexameric protein [Bacteroidota bacterium]